MNVAVPAGWKLMRVDHVAYESRAVLDPATLGDQTVFHYSIPSIQECGDGVEQPANEIASLKLLITDDVVLVSKLNPDQGIVLSARPRGFVTLASSEFVPLRPRRIERGFLQYLFMSYGVRCDLVSRTQSATKSHRRAKPDDIKKTWFALPNVQAQRSVMDYLDSETSRIDSLIDRKQRFIDLLLEKRTALITHAVTKGLDPNVEMKDTGVEWLPVIPSGWDAMQIARVLAANVTDGPHETPEFIDEGVPFLSVDGIQDGELVFDGCRHVSAEDHERFCKKTRVRRNDVLMGKAASTGKIARVKTDREFSVWSPLAVIRVRDRVMDSAYFEYALKAYPSQVQIDLFCNSNTQKNIAMSDIPRIVLPVPSLQEQREIVAHLECELNALDRLAGKTRESIELLTEYRTALISAAVTGQIEIPTADSGEDVA